MAIITDGGTIITVPSARPVYTPGSDLKYWWPMQAAGIPMSSYGYLSANTYSLDVANGTPQYQYAQYGTEYVVRFDHEDTANNELVETGNSIFADSCQSASVEFIINKWGSTTTGAASSHKVGQRQGYVAHDGARPLVVLPVVCQSATYANDGSDKWGIGYVIRGGGGFTIRWWDAADAEFILDENKLYHVMMHAYVDGNSDFQYRSYIDGELYQSHSAAGPMTYIGGGAISNYVAVGGAKGSTDYGLKADIAHLALWWDHIEIPTNYASTINIQITSAYEMHSQKFTEI